MTEASSNGKLVSEMFIAYLGNNKIDPSQIEYVVRGIERALLSSLFEERPANIELGKRLTITNLRQEQEPAVPIGESVTCDYLICLEDGRQFKSLKQHLGKHGMTPDEYRKRWKLPRDYPMVALKTSEIRSKIAKKSWRGRKRPAAR